jgi:hypothetical protein
VFPVKVAAPLSAAAPRGNEHISNPLYHFLSAGAARVDVIAITQDGLPISTVYIGLRFAYAAGRGTSKK